jgi:hypothetical protein|tara:strand:+ start:31 stop:669 length:639 start_codon:yes stop_codon:yes gene_type:complete
MASSTDKIQRLEDKKEEIINLVGKEVYYLALSKEKMIQENSRIDLGKLFANPNEFIQADWINETTNLNVKRRDADDGSNNGDGYDLITTDHVFTIQSKLRVKQMHLECTRRLNEGGKNDHAANNTGSVRYKVDEADVFIFSKPLGFNGEAKISNYVDIDKWEFITIPAAVLEDPKAPGYCYANVPKSVWGQYVGRAVEVLESEYLKKIGINE